jgi:hypothetical protein
MQEREAKLLHKSNDLESISIHRAEDKNGWVMQLIDKNGNKDYLVSKRHDSPRIFKTSDAALRCSHKIGIKQVDVIL